MSLSNKRNTDESFFITIKEVFNDNGGKLCYNKGRKKKEKHIRRKQADEKIIFDPCVGGGFHG